MGMIYRLTALLVMVLAPLSLALTLPLPTSDYANDFAGVLSKNTISMINRESAELEKETGAQVVVVTVKSLQGSDIEDYAIRLAREWEIGDREQNNGLLLLLAPNEREVRIEVGYGLEGAINDAKAGRLLDTYAIPYFRESEWDEGVRGLYSALLQEVYKECGTLPSQTTHVRTVRDSPNSYKNAIFIAIFGMVAAFVYCMRKSDTRLTDHISLRGNADRQTSAHDSDSEQESVLSYIFHHWLENMDASPSDGNTYVGKSFDRSESSSDDISFSDGYSSSSSSRYSSGSRGSSSSGSSGSGYSRSTSRSTSRYSGGSSRGSSSSSGSFSGKGGGFGGGGSSRKF